jgi:hypothetical protein
MMIKKIAVVLALVGLSVSSAQAITFSDMEIVTNFCKKAYADYRTTGKPTMLQKGMDSLSADGKAAMGLSCYAYAEGFQDGEKFRRSVVQIT